MYSLLLLISIPLLISATPGPGGIQTLDVNDPTHMDKIWTGLSLINAVSDSPNYLVPVKVLSATSQVVSGMKYTWEVEMAETDCNKANSNFDRNTCVASANSPTSTYELTLVTQEWLHQSQYSVVKIN